jgi:hypothetical protein
MAKLVTQRAAFDVMDTCLQLHGGAGYMREYEIERMAARRPPRADRRRHRRGHARDPRQDDGASLRREPRAPARCTRDMRRLPLLLAALVLLALAPAAGAKEVGSLTLCGTNGCHGVPGEAAKRAFENSGMTAPAPDRAERFLQLRVQIREGDQQVAGFAVRWLPGAGVIRSTDDGGYATWSRPAAALPRAAPRRAGPRAQAGGRPRHAAHRPAAARAVDEVFVPAAEHDRAGDEGGTSTLGLAAGAGALALAGVGLARRLRRPH